MYVGAKDKFAQTYNNMPIQNLYLSFHTYSVNSICRIWDSIAEMVSVFFSWRWISILEMYQHPQDIINAFVLENAQNFSTLNTTGEKVQWVDWMMYTRVVVRW